MRKVFAALALITFGVAQTSSIVQNAQGTAAMANQNQTVESKLKSKTIHYTAEDYAKYSAECNETQIKSAETGKDFLDIIPFDEIAAIEIQGDEVALPSAITETLIVKGQFVEPKALPAVQSAPAMRVRLKNKSCIVFNLVFTPAGKCFAQSSIGTLTIPPDMQCKSAILGVHLGMTRMQVQKLFHQDGGISAPFTYERFVFTLNKQERTDKKVVKVNFAFKPAGMSDAVFHLGKWQRPKQSEQDTVVHVSPAYLEAPYFD